MPRRETKSAWSVKVLPHRSCLPRPPTCYFPRRHPRNGTVSRNVAFAGAIMAACACVMCASGCVRTRCVAVNPTTPSTPFEQDQPALPTPPIPPYTYRATYFWHAPELLEKPLVFTSLDGSVVPEETEPVGEWAERWLGSFETLPPV